MRLNKQQSEFFVVGGTLHQESPSYIKRPADDELYEAASAGEFCYVLTARQMGKSSLMVRTARRLDEKQVKSVIIDLTKIGTGMPAEQWYLGLLVSISAQLNLQIRPQAWWQTHEDFSPVQRFTEFLHNVVLTEIKQPVVIFIDEIDTTLSLDFSDDFFAAIRSIYNARATDPNYRRLTFVLLGVALPADLVKARHRTPFNIGLAIDLEDFRKSDAQHLQQGLEAVYGERAGRIFGRIFYWTSGHPYLTQKLCATIATQPGRWTDKQIDLLVERLFLGEEARRETNLQFIRNSIITSPQRREIVKLYRQVYENKRIAEDERSLTQNQLRLIGLVKAADRALQVRNRIYKEAFNLDWIEANTTTDWTRRIILAAVIIAMLLLAIFGFNRWRQPQQAEAAVAQSLIRSFNEAATPVQRLGSLNNLLTLGDDGAYKEVALSLYDALSPNEKIALFTDLSFETDGSLDPTLQAQLDNVIQNVYVYYYKNTEANNELLAAMQLVSSDGISRTKTELEHWVNGRSLARQGDHTAALEKYEVAKTWNDPNNQQNPGIYFDRAVSYIDLGDVESGAADLEKTLELSDELPLGSKWMEAVTEQVHAGVQLRDLILNQRDQFPRLYAMISE